GASIAAVLLEPTSLQRDAGKQSAGSRIRKYLGVHGDVCVSRCGASNWAGRRRGIRSELHPVGHKGLDSLLIHEEHDDVDCLSADLQPKRSTTQSVERRSAPALAGAASDHTLTVFRSKTKTSLHHRGNHANALCMSQDFLRYALVGSRSDLVQDGSRFVEPRSEFFTITFAKAHRGQNDGGGDNGD